MAGDTSLPPIGQQGRLHAAGRSVPVEVYDQVRDSVKLDLIEDGWQLTDGEARFTYSGPDGAVIIAGAMRVLSDGTLLFTPGALTQDVDPDDGDEAFEDVEEVVGRQGRGQTGDIGQRRETFRVDLLLDVVVVSEGRELAAQTVNVSPTGCLLRGDQRPFVDTIVVVRIPVGARLLEADAQVIRVEGERYALHFRELDVAQERLLSGLIAKRQREILRRR